MSAIAQSFISIWTVVFRNYNKEGQKCTDIRSFEGEVSCGGALVGDVTSSWCAGLSDRGTFTNLRIPVVFRDDDYDDALN
jgi:hypothetical protein